MPNSNVMVIGANGLLGVNLCSDLAKLGTYTIFAVDRFTSEPRIGSNPNIRLIRSSISELVIQPEIFSEVDTVVYLASGLSPGVVLDESEIFHRQIVFNELIATANRFEVKKFIFASTGGAMFSDSGSLAHTEQEIPSPKSQYAQEKLNFENILINSELNKEKNTVIFRGSNFYGYPLIQRMNHGVIPSLVHSAISGEDFTLLGSGQEIRDFIDVRDVSRMVIELVNKTPKHTLYNISSGKGHSILEVIELVRSITGSNFILKSIPAPESFVSQSVLDPSLYASEFGLSAKIELEEGLNFLWKAIRAEGIS